MTPRRPLKTALVAEDGIAMTVVIMAAAIVLLLAGFAATRAGESRESTDVDRRVKAALQSADSGLETALLHYNKYADATQPCVVPGASGTLVQSGYASGTWCPAVTETYADGSSATSQMSGPDTSGATVKRTLVSTGLYRGRQRRVLTTLAARKAGTSLFGTYGIAAKDDILMENNVIAGSAATNVNVRSNGSITMKNHAQVCGEVSAGPGRSVSDQASPDCTAFRKVPVTEPLVFPPFDFGNVATVNDNGRFCKPDGDACEDPGNVKYTATASKRELILENHAKLYLGGDNYHFCRLNLKNLSELVIAPRTTGSVRIFLGGPQCEFEEQLMIENNIGIRNLNSSPITLQIFAFPNKDGKSKLNIKNNSANPTTTPLTLYAPESHIIIENNVQYVGGIVGRTVHLKNNATVGAHADTASLTGGDKLIYQPTQYRECAPQGATSTNPAAGC